MESHQMERQIHIEELEVGDIATTAVRTISASEAELFAILTGDPLPQFLSRQLAQSRGFRDQLVPGYLTLSLAAGLRYQSGLTSHVIAFMGMNKVRLISPVYVGDSIKAQIELLNKASAKRADQIVCTYRWSIINQNDTLVAEGENT